MTAVFVIDGDWQWRSCDRGPGGTRRASHHTPQTKAGCQVNTIWLGRFKLHKTTPPIWQLLRLFSCRWPFSVCLSYGAYCERKDRMRLAGRSFHAQSFLKTSWLFVSFADWVFDVSWCRSSHSLLWYCNLHFFYDIPILLWNSDRN